VPGRCSSSAANLTISWLHHTIACRREDLRVLVRLCWGNRVMTVGMPLFKVHLARRIHAQLAAHTDLMVCRCPDAWHLVSAALKRPAIRHQLMQRCQLLRHLHAETAMLWKRVPPLIAVYVPLMTIHYSSKVC
jgi:hypothetical protein